MRRLHWGAIIGIVLVVLPAVAQEPFDRAMLARIKEEGLQRSHAQQLFLALTDGIGARLTGSLSSPSGAPAGVGVYDFATKTTTKISADPTYGVLWLADSRRVIYFTNRGWQLVVVDTVTKARTVVPLRLPAPSTIDVFAISPDNRHIYYGGARAEADIWILERK